MSVPHRLWLGLVFSTLPSVLPAQGEWTLGLDELYRLDQLPRFKRSTRVASVSSYDRTGGNDDGFSGAHSFVRKESEGLVIADLEGPGIIYRIWTPTPTDDPVEFFFDGEEKPRLSVKFRDLFTGQEPPFVEPLVGYGAGGFFSYVPLPFRESCKVLVRAEKVQFYQINYAIYPDDAPVRTIEVPSTREYSDRQERAQKLFASTASDITPHVVAEGSVVEVTRRDVSLAPGASVTLFETQTPGRIAALRLSPPSAFEGKGRDILLRITWDNATEPAVFLPAGDFFGYAWGKPAVTSLLVGTAHGVNYCYYPMPFDRSARLELVSMRRDGSPVEIRSEVAFAPLARSKEEGEFYAVWRRENPTRKGVPFTFVETEGRGHIVGCILQAQGPDSGNTYFFEGDDQTTIDGQLVIHGTGSEDLFNGGWYDVPGRWEKRLSFPLSGCLGYWKPLGRTGGYRLFVGDAYAYRKGIVHTIEHAPTGNSLLTDYCAVTYLYSDKPPTGKPGPTSAEARRVVDFDRLVFIPGWYVPIHAFTFKNAVLTKKDEKLGDETVRFLSMTAEGEDWFGPPFLSLTCDIPVAGHYKVSVEAMRGPAQARVQLFEKEAPVGEAVDLYAETREKSSAVALGVLDLREGPNHLMLKLVGKNPDAKGLGLDLIRVVCERVKRARVRATPSVGDWGREYTVCRPLPLGAVRLGGFLGTRVDASNRTSLLAGLESPIPQAFEARHRGDEPPAATRRLATDSDFFKWLEGAAYAVTYDDSLEDVATHAERYARMLVKQQEPGGYLGTRVSPREPFDQRVAHDLYVAGHFIEAAVAHFRATGKPDLLDAAKRFADFYLRAAEDRHEYFSIVGTREHPEVELALVRLARATQDRRYLEFAMDVARLARIGPKLGDVHAGGGRTHAVRLSYLLAGCAEIYMETGDRSFLDPILSLWQAIVSSRMYVTGGVGYNERIPVKPYDLPQTLEDNPHRDIAETCASVALMMFTWRLHAITGASSYMDVLETILYNHYLGAIAKDHLGNFYYNPLRRVGDLKGKTDHGGNPVRRTRLPDIHSTTCCLPNAWRFFSQLPEYVFSTRDDGLVIQLYTDAVVHHRLESGAQVTVKTATRYPFDGEVKVFVNPERPSRFALLLRIPAWCTEPRVAVADNPPTDVSRGTYHVVEREWRRGDTVQLSLPMEPMGFFGRPQVAANRGQVAFQRGPLVYCLEKQDAAGLELARTVLAVDRDESAESATEAFSTELGVPVLKVKARERGAIDSREVTLIPFYARANRDPDTRWLTFIPLE